MSGEGTDELGLKNLGGLRMGSGILIQGVRPELLLGLMILSDMCMLKGTVVVITSILDGLHMRNSLHYTGAAVDFVIDLTSDHEPWVAELRTRLGLAFDVIDEGTHIHMEYQPHDRAGH